MTGLDGATSVKLDAEMVSGLVAHALNSINMDDDRCCPQCCAPCASLKALLDAGLLDDAVRPFVQRTGEWDWWLDGKVDRVWLRLAWTMEGCH